RDTTIAQPNAEDFIICKPNQILYPSNLSEVVSGVKSAIAQNKKVRAFAAGHSTNYILCTDGVSISTTQNLTGIVSVDQVAKTVKVYGGSRLATFTHELREKYNLAILGLVDYGAITVAGSIATGAHSSSLNYPAAVHDHVIAFTIVDGTGAVQTLTKADAVDAFKVKAAQVDLSSQIDNLENVIIPAAKAHDFANVYWFPSQKTAIVHGFDKVASNTTGTGYRTTWNPYPSLVPWAWSRLVEPILEAASENELCLLADARATQLKGVESNDTVGWYGDMYMGHICDTDGCLFPKTDDIEVAVPLASLPAIIKDIRAIVGNTLACFPEFGIYIRFGKASDGLLGIQYGQDVALVETHILRAMNAELRTPNWSRFQAVRTKFDPNNIFTNEFTGKFQASYQSPTTAGCAVTRNCHCTADIHCGDGYVCLPGRTFKDVNTCYKAKGTGCGRDD
ncbi:hypothetical protein HDU76_007356, partial [Blyttiomyces sp. JEL0837]